MVKRRGQATWSSDAVKRHNPRTRPRHVIEGCDRWDVTNGPDVRTWPGEGGDGDTRRGGGGREGGARGGGRGADGVASLGRLHMHETGDDQAFARPVVPRANALSSLSALVWPAVAGRRCYRARKFSRVRAIRGRAQGPGRIGSAMRSGDMTMGCDRGDVSVETHPQGT